MVIVLFGVSGAGKTTVGKLLAADLGWSFIDADAYHTPANIEKMSNGIPLNDADREGWLDSVSNAIREHIENEKDVVLACSALKTAYRERLDVGRDVTFVYLKADPAVTAKRLTNRTEHFMKPSLLKSQYETLEEPGPSTLAVDTRLKPIEIAEVIKRQLFN